MRRKRLLLPGALALLMIWPAAASAVDPTGTLTRTAGNGLRAMLHSNDGRDILAIQIGLDAGGAVISAAPAPAVIGAPGGCNPPVANTVLCNVAWMPGPLAVDFSTDALYPDGGGATLIGCFAPCGPADNFGPVSIPGPGTTTPPSPPSTPQPPTPPPTPPPGTPPPAAGADLRSVFELPESVPLEGPDAPVVLPVFVFGENAGPLPATDAGLRITATDLPRGATVSQSGHDPSGLGQAVLCRDQDPRSRLCPLGQLLPGGERGVEVDIGLSRSGGRVALVAEVASSTPDPQPGNNRATLEIDVPVLPWSAAGRLRLAVERPRIEVSSRGTDTMANAARRGSGTPRRAGRVQVAIARLVGGAGVATAAGRRARRACLWISSRRGRTKRETPDGRTCTEPVWLDATEVTPRRRRSAQRRRAARRRARGSGRTAEQSWVLQLRRKLRCGRYVVLTRAIGPSGAYEARFTEKDGNRRTVTVRRKRC